VRRAGGPEAGAMKTLVLGVVCLAATAATSGAQEPAPAAEFQVGYSYLYDNEIRVGDSGSFPLGWQAALHLPLADTLGLVVDGSGHYKSPEGPLEDDEDLDVDLSVHGIHAGLRLTSRSSSVQPYIQLLAGVTRVALDVADEGDGVTDFSLQPGIGIVLPLSESLGLGIGGDYRLVFAEEEKAHEFRAHAGLVLRFGSR
jgi:hypothetical protein